MTPLEAAALQGAYAARRRAYREEHPVASPRTGAPELFPAEAVEDEVIRRRPL